MKKISAPSIELALMKASEELQCSCLDLEYEVVQQPKNGIFGLGKQEAQIIVSRKNKSHNTKPLKKQAHIDLESIQNEINELFALLPFTLNTIKVSKFDTQTLLIYFSGDDAALLIGEKGYRYKAISYILFNWLNPKYMVNVRLEIEQFLHNQEQILQDYLKPIIENIEQKKKMFIPKPLDEVMSYLALKMLRERFPDKYISIKINNSNQTCIEIIQYDK